MELQLAIVCILFIASIFFVINYYRSSNALDKNTNLPPEPWKIPVIGHIHHLFGAHPHIALENLAKKLGPIVHLQLGQISAIIISSPILAKEIMKTHDLSFANRPKVLTAEILLYNYTDIAFCPYGDYWRQMRKICVLELLSAKKVQSYRSIREEESRKLVEFTSKHRSNTINLSEKFFTMMNTITSRVALGSSGDKDHPLLLRQIEKIVLLLGGFDLYDLFPSIKVLHLINGSRNKLLKIRKETDEILDRIISNHEKRRVGEHSDQTEDIIDVLLRLRDDDGHHFALTTDNIKAVIVDVFIAGVETSATTIEWAMSELMKNPRMMKKVQAELRQTLKGKIKIQESDIQELDYLKLVIKETLRLHPPVPLLLPRECREKCEIGGYHIPVKTKVIINAWKIGRDPDYWIDHESFIPERFITGSMGTNFEYLPFGAGRRICPGMLMGQANVELPLAMLLYHFNWDLPNGLTSKSFDMSESYGPAVHRKNHLLLVPTPYNTN